eukprot:TRINITY_DN68010_c0_g1_i1.p1 TRINITY_DN68010_c0_g1~~TRINITY_DN68010_c0_g1_i1.p1  ORF type:complete len:401 (-),score=63.62 TRINITY_DN68010_c0_g1_i1:47-1090(-)
MDACSEQYEVTYCEHFETGEASSTSVFFCVKRWKESPKWHGKYELLVECELPHCDTLPLDPAIGPRPALIWDVWGSSSLAWSSPWLPSTETSHEEDWGRRCVVTRFGPTTVPCQWRATLTWPYDPAAPAFRQAPQRLAVKILTPDGRRLGHPVNSRCFQIPLREEPSPHDFPALPGLFPADSSWAATSSESDGQCRRSAELQEAMNELERQRALCLSAEAAVRSWDDHLREIEQMVAQRPETKVISTLQLQLGEEVSLRERCQAELAELRSFPTIEGSVSRRRLGRLLNENARLRAATRRGVGASGSVPAGKAMSRTRSSDVSEHLGGRGKENHGRPYLPRSVSVAA